MHNAHIQVQTLDQVGVIQLDRPNVANALNRKMVAEIVEQAESFDRDGSIRVIVIKGNEKIFAAGADIAEMKNETPLSLEQTDQFAVWDRLTLVKKPVIASVQGLALGGGFELALHCDLVIAAEDAKFGFPEVTLGVMPSAGGTQLLTRLIGRTKALEWIWFGEFFPAQEALKHGIINRAVAKEVLEEETMQWAARLAEQAPVALRLIKEAVHHAEDTSLAEGKTLERKNFYLTFGTDDQKEGMDAFGEKRKPFFKGE